MPTNNEPYADIIDEFLKQEFENTREAETWLRIELAKAGLSDDEVEEVMDSILRKYYNLVQQVFTKFKVERGDRNAIVNIIFNIKTGIQADVDKENIRKFLYRHELGHFLEKYKGLFEFLYEKLLPINLPEATKKSYEGPEYGMLIVRAFWYYRGERPAPAPRREIDTDIFLESQVRIPELERRFQFSRRGYFLGRTPFEIALSPGSYTLVCEYTGTGQFEQRIQKTKSPIKISGSKRTAQNFYFEIIPSSAGGRTGDINIDVHVPEPPPAPPEPEPPPAPPEPEPEPEPPPILPRITIRTNIRIGKGLKNLKGVQAKIDDDKGWTPFTIAVDPGTHRLWVPDKFLMGSKNYKFVRWSDGEKKNERNVTVGADAEFIAVYESEPVVYFNLEIKSWPVEGADVQIFSIERKTKEPELYKPGTPLAVLIENIRTHPRGGPGIADALQRITDDFNTEANINHSFKNREEAEKWLTRRLDALATNRLVNDIYDRILRTIMNAVFIEGTRTTLKEGAMTEIPGVEMPVAHGKTPVHFHGILPGHYRLKIQTPFGEGYNLSNWTTEPQNLTFFKSESITEETRPHVSPAMDMILQPLTLRAGRFTIPGEYAEGTSEIDDAEEGLPEEYYGTKDYEPEKPITITAYYAKTDIEHKRYPTARSAYQGGVMGKGVKDTGIGLLGKETFSRKRSAKVEAEKLEKMLEKSKGNPYLNMAINKGRRILIKYAKAEYSRTVTPMLARFDKERKELAAEGKQAAQAYSKLRRRLLKKHSWKMWRNIGLEANDAMNQTAGIEEEDIAQARMILKDYMDHRDKFEERFQEELATASNALRDYLRGKAKTITVGLARRYKLPLGSADKGDSDYKLLYDALQGYADTIAEDFMVRGRRVGHAMLRGLGTASRALQTVSGFGDNFLTNLWTFITGPWTISTIFVIIQFFFVLTYVGYSLQLLYVMPLISAVFVWLLNFADTMRPFDWLTHFMCGAMIGYSAELLLIALGAHTWSFIGGTNTFAFWIAWIILCFIGIFQFYQTGEK